jgi:hypothetical protein
LGHQHRAPAFYGHHGRAYNRPPHRSPAQRENTVMTSSGWVCLQVFAFQEKRVAAALLMRHGLATLLPTINHQFIIRGQKRSRLYPLFPGYLFLEMFAEKPISLYAFRFVEGYIRTLTVGGSDGVPAIMPKAFMADLQERIDAEGAFIVDPDQNKLLKGQRMRCRFYFRCLGARGKCRSRAANWRVWIRGACPA